MTMYGAPFGSVPTSKTRATCSLANLGGCSRLAEGTGRRRPWSPSMCGCMNLIATRSSSCKCRAATTTPMPPAPSTLSMRYFPATTSPSRTLDSPRETTRLRPDAVQVVASRVPSAMRFVPGRLPGAFTGGPAALELERCRCGDRRRPWPVVAAFRGGARKLHRCGIRPPTVIGAPRSGFWDVHPPRAPHVAAICT